MIETFWRDFSQIRDRQFSTWPLIQYHLIDENPARLSVRAEPCCQLDRLAEKVAMLFDWLAGADPDAYIRRRLAMLLVVCRESFLYGDRALHRIRNRERNDAMMPSPVCLISRPRLEFSEFRISALCTCIRWSALASP